MQTDGRTDKHMTKLIVAFNSFVNASKKSKWYLHLNLIDAIG